jgi:hypothetical protein
VAKHAQPVGSNFKPDIVQVFPEMALFALGGDACADALLITPALSAFVHFGFDFREICPKLEQLFVKC